MTLKLDLRREAYFYAQDLDNEGGVRYFRTTDNDAPIEQVDSSDQRLPQVRRLLDEIQNRGRAWAVAGNPLPCRVSFSGDCVVEVHPVTLDSAGRVSPVLLLFNALSQSRSLGTTALTSVATRLNRTLDKQTLDALGQLKRLLALPRWIIFLHIIFNSQRARRD